MTVWLPQWNENFVFEVPPDFRCTEQCCYTSCSSCNFSDMPFVDHHLSHGAPHYRKQLHRMSFGNSEHHSIPGFWLKKTNTAGTYIMLWHYFDCTAANVASKRQPKNCQLHGGWHKMHHCRALNLQNLMGAMQKDLLPFEKSKAFNYHCDEITTQKNTLPLGILQLPLTCSYLSKNTQRDRKKYVGYGKVKIKQHTVSFVQTLIALW